MSNKRFLKRAFCTVEALTPEIFKKYLMNQTTSKGDPLSELTVEKYLNIAIPAIKKKDKFFSSPESADKYINEALNRTRSIVMYYSLQHLFDCIGWTSHFKNILKPSTNNRSLKSKSFMQSKVMTRNELKRMIDQVDNKNFEVALRLLYDTAARRSEICRLRWKDVVIFSTRNPEHKALMKRGMYGIVPLVGKGNKARETHLSKETWECIRKRHFELPWNPYDNLVRFKNLKGGGWVDNPEHKLYRLVKKHTREVLGRDLSPHCLRHSRISHMADNGVDTNQIRAYAGHENLATTQIYIEISTFQSRLAFENYSKGI